MSNHHHTTINPHYDPEAVYQDADFEQAEMEAESARIRHLEAQGICTHQARMGRGNGEGPLPGGFYYEGQSEIPEGKSKCCDCGEILDDNWY